MPRKLQKTIKNYRNFFFFPPYLPLSFWHAWSFECLYVIVISLGNFHTIDHNGQTREMRIRDGYRFGRFDYGCFWFGYH